MTPDKIVVVLTVAADVSDFPASEQLELRVLAAGAVNVDISFVALEVKTASVLMTITITTPPTTTSTAVQTDAENTMGTPALASATLGIPVVGAEVNFVDGTTQGQSSDGGGGGSSNAGVIAGAVVGAIVLLALLGFAFLYYGRACCNRKRALADMHETGHTAEDYSKRRAQLNEVQPDIGVETMGKPSVWDEAKARSETSQGRKGGGGALRGGDMLRKAPSHGKIRDASPSTPLARWRGEDTGGHTFAKHI